MHGYWGDDALSSRVLCHDIVPGQIVYRTGDLVYRDERTGTSTPDAATTS